MPLDCVIGRRRITIQLPSDSFAKDIILKHIAYLITRPLGFLRKFFFNFTQSLFSFDRLFFKPLENSSLVRQRRLGLLAGWTAVGSA
jgi:hypothetical protein